MNRILFIILIGLTLGCSQVKAVPIEPTPVIETPIITEQPVVIPEPVFTQPVTRVTTIPSVDSIDWYSIAGFETKSLYKDEFKGYNNPLAHDPTEKELEEFLETVHLDFRDNGCVLTSVRLHNRAELAGIKAGIINVAVKSKFNTWYAFQRHTLNMFYLFDKKQLVYVDFGRGTTILGDHGWPNEEGRYW